MKFKLVDYKDDREIIADYSKMEIKVKYNREYDVLVYVLTLDSTIYSPYIVAYSLEELISKFDEYMRDVLKEEQK